MKRFKLLIGLASVFMFLLFSCTKDEAVGNTITEEQTENRALETALSGIDNSQNITTDCGEMQMANTEILVSGPKVKTSAVNQIKLSQFYQKMLESNTFLWDSNFQKIYGVPFFDMGLYFENSNNTFIKLPVFDDNKNKVTSFFTVLKVSDRVFEYSFIDRSFHELAFAANPSDPINAKNQTLFRLFDYGVCNEQVPPDITGGNSESPDCITGTGTVAVLMQVDCQDAGCNDCPGTCYGEENVDYVTYGPCYGSSNSSGSNGSGSGSGYGGGGGYYGGNGTSNSPFATIISIHNSNMHFYLDYVNSLAELNITSIDQLLDFFGPAGNRFSGYLLASHYYNQYMISGESVSFKDLIEAAKLWLYNTTPPVQEIDNGIDIKYGQVASTTPNNYFLAGGAEPLGNVEDLTHGYFGNDKNIGLKALPIPKLWEEMEDLMTDFSTGAMENVALDMMSYFKNNNSSSNRYSNFTLSNEILNSVEMRNFVKVYGKRLNDRFKEFGFMDVGAIYLDQNVRPIFNSLNHRANGLQICVHSSEETRVSRVNDLIFNTATGEWECTLYVEMFDHFGLDRQDVLDYQLYNEGFAAWWRLQHRYNYKPFITYVPLLYKIKGKI